MPLPLDLNRLASPFYITLPLMSTNVRIKRTQFVNISSENSQSSFTKREWSNSQIFVLVKGNIKSGILHQVLTIKLSRTTMSKVAQMKMKNVLILLIDDKCSQWETETIYIESPFSNWFL